MRSKGEYHDLRARVWGAGGIYGIYIVYHLRDMRGGSPKADMAKGDAVTATQEDISISSSNRHIFF